MSFLQINCTTRFIPVDTGNTTTARLSSSEIAVYPRGYGEHFASNAGLTSVDGLSPWIRGTPPNDTDFPFRRRFIPVDTGNTGAFFCVANGCAVYPRGYGEHYLVRLVSAQPHGLSPWIRGTLLRF